MLRLNASRISLSVMNLVFSAAISSSMLLAGCDAGDDAASNLDAQSLNAQPRQAIFNSNQPAPVDDQNDLAAYVAQCEAVLGDIPQISCDPENPAPNTTVTKIPVFVEGMLLGFDDKLSEQERVLLAQRALDGDYSCDFPSIGGDFACSVGSTLVHYQNPENPNVQWVGLCRGVGEDNPSYDRFIGNGLIGANEITGEMCFFFGANPEPEQPYELPQLRSDVEDSAELGNWLPPREMPGSCISCHPNNDPWIMTPWLQPAYMQTVLSNPEYPLLLPDDVTLEETSAARFIKQTKTKYKTMMPEPLPEGRTAWTEEEIIGPEGELLLRQYRPVGSSYVNAEAKGEVRPRTGQRPDSWSINFRDRIRLQEPSKSCANGCHAIGNEHFINLANDSLGTKYGEKYLTDLMHDDSDVGMAWMPPVAGIDLEEWKSRFSTDGFTIPAITECPIPKQLTDEPSVEVSCNADGSGTVHVAWEYVNNYGDVPNRDDVRFDVGLTDPDADVSSRSGRFPGSEVEGMPMMEGFGTEVHYDIAPDEGSSDYALAVSFSAGQDHLFIDLQPKRFCFEEPDRRPFAYAPSHRIEVDLSSCQ